MLLKRRRRKNHGDIAVLLAKGTMMTFHQLSCSSNSPAVSLWNEISSVRCKVPVIEVDENAFNRLQWSTDTGIATAFRHERGSSHIFLSNCSFVRPGIIENGIFGGTMILVWLRGPDASFAAWAGWRGRLGKCMYIYLRVGRAPRSVVRRRCDTDIMDVVAAGVPSVQAGKLDHSAMEATVTWIAAAPGGFSRTQSRSPTPDALLISD